MRAPNSPRPLRAASSSLLALVLSSVVLTILLLASPASTRSVARPRAVGAADHGVIGEESSPPSHLGVTDVAAGNGEEVDAHDVVSPGITKRDKVEENFAEDGDASLASEIGASLEVEGAIGKSSVTSELSGAKDVEVSAKSKREQEGIRRFDAVVVSDDAIEKIPAKEPKERLGSSEIGKTVVKGIIVRDAVAATDDGIDGGELELAPAVVELSGVKVQRKRSVADPESADSPPVAVEPSLANENPEAANDAGEKIADSAESRQVPVLTPVGSSHAKLTRAEIVPAAEPSLVEEKESLGEPADLATAEESSVKIQAEAAQEEIVREIPELTLAHEKSVEPPRPSDAEPSNAEEEIVVPETKRVIIHEDGLGEVVDGDSEVVNEEQVFSARKSLPISEESERDEESEEQRAIRSDEPAKIDDEIPRDKETPIRSATSDQSYSGSLVTLMTTQGNPEDLKAQAMSLQREIRDKAYLQSLREKATEILPGIPKFTELELLDSLRAITSLKNLAEAPDSSYLKIDNTTNLNESQLAILKSTEALLAREQRQTFAENVMECIRGLDIINCMRIFVWPIIADNLPQSFVQNLPTLPIEINVSDFLPGGQKQDQPKATGSRSSSDQPHQQRLITPELVVSSILKDALNAEPTRISDSLPSLIDPQNETLTKWLTPGQLEILKMGEKFLTEAEVRQEYSNRMSSCVRRFEYFSCLKYFAWPMVKQSYPALPDFPDYQSWYPSVALYPGYPILPYPNTEGIGELPEVVEADATRTRSPRPEAVIVQILENTLRQMPGYPGLTPTSYQSRQPGTPPVLVPAVTPEQMAIFYTAQQLIPVQLRADYMAKTMRCIRDYDYLTCTKYSTWPTVRQWFPSLPELPDFSSWIPTFAIPELPDFSQYIPDWGSIFPGIPGIPGGSSKPPAEPAPQPQPQPIPDKPPQEVNATIISKEEQRVSGPTASLASPIENRIIFILSNIKWIPLARNAQPIASVTPESLAVLKTLTYSQLRILGLAKAAIPPPVQGDLDSRFVGCLQGGSDFLSCARNVIWPTLQLYVKNMPAFPEDEAAKIPESNHAIPAIKPGVYQPLADSAQPVFFDNPASPIAARSPIGGHIDAEPEAESAVPISEPGVSQEAAVGRQDQLGQLRQGATAKSSDPSIPVISVTDTRFTPIFSDHPETVLLNILTTIQASSKYSEGSYSLDKPGYMDSLNDHLNADQKNVIRVSASLLPEEVKSSFIERVRGCVTKSNFIVCSRDIVWPSLSQYYQRLPSFPNFYINEKPIDTVADIGSSKHPIATGGPAISETNVNTGQHGDAVVTITDTRFVPIFSQHPEAVILSILRNVQATSPNLLAQPGATKTASRSPEFTATFTDQQNNIVNVAENLLPESIRDVFERRMLECARENSFLACTRDIAWPTIAQFFPRLPNFPNVFFAIEEPQQPAALLPPQLEPAAKPATLTPSALPSLPAPPGLPSENLVPISPTDPPTSRTDAALNAIFQAPSYPVYPKVSYIDGQDPLIASRITETQVNILRWLESLLPEEAKPIFGGKVADCVRSDDFPNCIESCGWSFFQRYVPNVPNFPDLRIYFPRYPQEIPKFPQYPDTQVPLVMQNPHFPPLEILRPHYGYPVQHALDKVIREGPGIRQQLGYRPADYVPEGLTASVGERSYASREQVPALPDGPGSLPSGLPSAGVSGEAAALIHPDDATRAPEGRRERRHIGDESPAKYQDISTEAHFEPHDELEPPGITESEFLEVLRNVTRASNAEEDQRDVLLNSTIKDSLTTEQLAIMKIVEDIGAQTQSKGLASQVWQCIRSLSFVRCVGIFVWPVVTQSIVPSIVGSLNPFGRSDDDDDDDDAKASESFEGMFGMTSEELERELLARKRNVEEILIDWYRGVVESKYDNDYGFVRVKGYGDGEIGISFNVLRRKGRGAKIKDSKNMPSILTIISDIMEDVLDSRPEKKEHGKRDGRLRREDERRADDYNRVYSESHDDLGSGAEERPPLHSERSSNDDEIINMFLDKIRVNGTGDTGGAGGTDGNNYLSIEDAYDAFELLFGTRLGERMAERLHDLDKNRYRAFSDEETLRKFDERLVENSEKSGDSFKLARKAEESDGDAVNNEAEERRKIRSDLVLRLPRLDEEFVSRKATIGLAELGRKMKMQMSQIVPGISFLVSFFIQMALAHARAAASVAGMMSNMALGSAMMSLIRQSFFGSMGHPKIKHVYDNAAMGPGITWPEHNHHG